MLGSQGLARHEWGRHTRNAHENNAPHALQTDLPRLLDMGQCNDSYGAIVVASELAKAFNCSVNDLPLSLDLSWWADTHVFFACPALPMHALPSAA